MPMVTEGRGNRETDSSLLLMRARSPLPPAFVALLLSLSSSFPLVRTLDSYNQCLFFKKLISTPESIGAVLILTYIFLCF